MTEIERQAVSLLDAATSDLAPDARELADRGVARGRTLRRRRRTTTALCAFAAVGAFGAAVVVPALGGSDAAGRGLDSVPLASQPSAPAPAAPGHPAPRDLGTRAAGVPDVFTSIFPGDVALVPGKENPMDAFDPRSQPLGGGQVDRQGEPGPGVIADFTWNGFYVRAAVAPSDPVWGDTARERCLGEVAGSDAVCEHVAGGGALVSRTMVNPPEDGTTKVRYVEYYTPDLWTVTLMISNGATSRDQVLAPQPPFTLAELTAAATSDVWFG